MKNGLFVKKLEVVISEKTWSLLTEVSKIIKTQEFGAFFNYEIIKEIDPLNKDHIDISIIIDEDIYIPKQFSSTAYFEIDQKESDYIFNEFKGAIHRHPKGFRSFSKTDIDNVNTSFDLSLIFIPEENFLHGVYSIKAHGDIFSFEKEIDSFRIGFQNFPIELNGEIYESKEAFEAEVIKVIEPLQLLTPKLNSNRLRESFIKRGVKHDIIS
jgi:hypothetical protein